MFYCPISIESDLKMVPIMTLSSRQFQGHENAYQNSTNKSLSTRNSPQFTSLLNLEKEFQQIYDSFLQKSFTGFDAFDNKFFGHCGDSITTGVEENKNKSENKRENLATEKSSSRSDTEIEKNNQTLKTCLEEASSQQSPKSEPNSQQSNIIANQTSRHNSPKSTYKSLFDEFLDSRTSQYQKYLGDFGQIAKLSDSKTLFTPMDNTIRTNIGSLQPQSVSVKIEKNVLTISGEEKTDSGFVKFQTARTLPPYISEYCMEEQIISKLVTDKLTGGKILEITLPEEPKKAIEEVDQKFKSDEIKIQLVDSKKSQQSEIPDAGLGVDDKKQD